MLRTGAIADRGVQIDGSLQRPVAVLVDGESALSPYSTSPALAASATQPTVMPSMRGLHKNGPPTNSAARAAADTPNNTRTKRRVIMKHHWFV
jgi:hypothetical protein